MTEPCNCKDFIHGFAPGFKDDDNMGPVVARKCTECGVGDAICLSLFSQERIKALFEELENLAAKADEEYLT